MARSTKAQATLATCTVEHRGRGFVLRAGRRNYRSAVSFCIGGQGKPPPHEASAVQNPRSGPTMNTLWCDSGSTHRRSMMDQRKTSGEYEKTRVDCCTALGVAGRGAITTTAAGCRRPDKHIDTPQYRCYLPRRNSRDVLQCTHQPEPSRLWINRGIRRRVRIGRRCRQHHAVHPSLFGIPPGQRTVQLTEGLAAVVLLVVSARNP